MRATRHQADATRRPLAAALALLALALPMAIGCSQKAPEEAAASAEQKKKAKPKPPFEPLRIFSEPNERSYSEPKEVAQAPVHNAIKPGHWTCVLVEGKANNFDFGGELVSEPRDNQQNPVDLEGSYFALQCARPAALAKGQKKSLEQVFFAPPWDRTQPTFDEPVIDATGSARRRRTGTWMRSQLRGIDGGAESRFDSELLAHLPSFQYYLVVLAREPARYRFLNVLESVRPLGGPSLRSAEDTAFYRTVFLPALQQPLALASHPLCWTAVSCVVWDDAPPSALSPEQQRALVDWIHWGGTLVISGPHSLDALRGSVLEPWLPAESAQNVELDEPALAELQKHWAVADGAPGTASLSPDRPWSAVQLAPRPEARFVEGTGSLVAERRVGRGRVVVTAFRLAEPELLRWSSFDSFFNGCILRHPRRRFDVTSGMYEFAGHGAEGRFEPALFSNVRYFTRDDSGGRDRDAARSGSPSAVADGLPTFEMQLKLLGESDQIDLLKTRPGVAAWNDFSQASSAASHALREAAGISVPKRSFVLRMVGLYLLLIVPLNWLVFRLLGRVEWAWIAVPVIALAWGGIVVWLAQLDIGFARAETEIAVLELQSDFPRAHLTRYTALYSSLSTSYNLSFEEESALAQPFAVDLSRVHGQQHANVVFRSGKERQLTDFLVSSNSTGMVHSEQMYPLPGGLAWRDATDAAPVLENRTGLDLHGAALVRRKSAGGGRQTVDQWAWLGDVAGDAKVDVAFHTYDAAALAAAREQSPLTSETAPGDRLNLRRLTTVAEDPATLSPGEVRLVAWREERFPGLRIEPAAPQSRQAALVVAHLRFGAWEAARPDENRRVALPETDLDGQLPE